jgi:hypothetical protein
MALPPNPVMSPAVTYEYLFYLPSSDWFPLAGNGWGTIHPVLDMAPPLLAEVDGPPT